MQLSPLAFHAWQDLLAFIEDDVVVFDALPLLVNSPRSAGQLERIAYGSDWLHLWQLSGRAAAATDRRYDVYVAVLTTLATRLAEACSSRRNVTAMWPTAQTTQPPHGGTNSNADHWPMVPASSTQDMFDLCAAESIMSHLRDALVISFLAAPGASRYHCL